MESEDCRLARLIVERIIGDLTGRKGLRHVWEEIDEDIREGIQQSWYEATLDLVRPALDKGTHGS